MGAWATATAWTGSSSSGRASALTSTPRRWASSGGSSGWPARAATRRRAAYARSHLTRADFDVLATLRRSGPEGSLSPSALSATLMLTSGGMTQRLDRLERAGLVRRSPDPADRRALRITLSDRGTDVVDEAVAAGLAAEQRLLASIPPQRRREIDAMLRELLAAVDAS